MAKQKENYLDYIPKQNSRFPYTTNQEGHIEVKVHNTGLFNRIAQLIFRRPRYSYIALDDFGSFVWQQINGERTIYDIAMLVKEKFGEEAEPLFERITTFFKILRKNSFILYLNKK